jgi:hypothetical protein
MHPPKHICDELERVHKWARLGWQGREKKGPDDLNPGQFVVLQLYHQRDAAQTLLQHWNNRGPVFGTKFDPLQRVPIMVKAVPTQAVFDGSVITLLREWIQPLKPRLDEAEAEATSNLDRQYTDMARERVSRMHHAANRTGATRPKPVARKFLTKRDRDILSGNVPKKMPKVGLGDARPGTARMR